LGAVLLIGYHIEARPAGVLGIASAMPCESWDVQLHLLMKLVGSSLATGLERITIQSHLHDLKERNELALYSANDGLWDFDTLNNRVYLSPRWKAMLGYDEMDEEQTPDWRTLVHSDDMSRVQAAIRDHVAGKTPIFESLHRMRHANGAGSSAAPRPASMTRDASCAWSGSNSTSRSASCTRKRSSGRRRARRSRCKVSVTASSPPMRKA
jgi:PAS domain-containing protein